MIKLYKQFDNGPLHYHEAWATDDQIVEHFGKVGTRGETRHHSFKNEIDQDTVIGQIAEKAFVDGFSEIDPEDYRILLIEYKVVGWGSESDLKKRHKLEERMNELLGWTGLGHCDVGSIGSGTMEVCCIVVNFDLARKTIETDIRNTEFADYSRIYDESE